MQEEDGKHGEEDWEVRRSTCVGREGTGGMHVDTLNMQDANANECRWDERTERRR